MKKLIALFALISVITSIKSQIRITMINPATNTITFHNYGSTTVNISSYWSCHQFSYWQLSQATIQSGSLNLAPNADVTLTAASSLNNSASDYGIYNSPSFGSASAMIDFTQWGSGGNGRENVAVAKGIWDAGTFIGFGESIYYIGDGNQNKVAYWSTTPPCNLGLSFSGTTLNCFGDTTANLCATVANGTAPYTYLWNNADTGMFVYNLSAGTYTVTVTDNAGCSITGDTTVVNPPLGIVSVTGSFSPSPTSRQLKWSVDNSCANEAVVRFRKLGSGSWKFVNLGGYVDSLVLNNLLGNTLYEWRVDVKYNGIGLGLTPPDTFLMPCGKPLPPITMVSYIQDAEHAVVKWSNEVCAEKAIVRYRKIGTNFWKFHEVNPYKDSTVINVMPTIQYEWRVQFEYQGLKSKLSLPDTFETPCGNMLPVASNLLSTNWVDTITGQIFAKLSWNSGICNKDEAIVRYRPVGGNWKFHQVSPYADTAVVGNLTSATNYEWKVVLKNQGNSSKLSSKNMFLTGCGGKPAPLSSFSHTNIFQDNNGMLLPPTVRLFWQKQDTCFVTEVVLRYKLQEDSVWTFVKQPYTDSLTLSNLMEGKMYDWRVLVKNGNQHSLLSPVMSFFAYSQLRLPNPNGNIEQDTKLEISPNPFVDNVQVSLSMKTNEYVTFEVFDLVGRHILSEKLVSNTTIIRFEKVNLGVYLYSIKNDQGELIEKGKLIKQ